MHHAFSLRSVTPEDQLLAAALQFVSRRAGANVGTIEVSVTTDTGFRYCTSLPSSWLSQLIPTAGQTPVQERPTAPPPLARPTVIVDPDNPILQGCPREIIVSLLEAKHCLTIAQLATSFSRRGVEYSETTIRGAAATMCDVGVLVNHQDTNPRGYDLAEWVKESLAN